MVVVWLWVVGCELWVVGCGLWVMGCGLWVMGYGLWVVVIAVVVEECGCERVVVLVVALVVVIERYERFGSCWC